MIFFLVSWHRFTCCGVGRVFFVTSRNSLPPLKCHCHGPVAVVPHANSRSILIINRKSVTTRCVWISYRSWNIGSMFKMKYGNVMMLTQWRASLSGVEAASKKLSVYHRFQYGSIHAVGTLTGKENILPSIYMHLFRQTATLNAGGVQMNEGVQKIISDPRVMWLLITIWIRLGHAVAQLVLRHCSTSGKVACSIPDGVVEIFHWHNPSGRTMALGLTQPLTQMSTRNSSWGVKAAGA
jgi:hypothetical protein